MVSMRKFATGAAASALALGLMSAAVQAQETTGGINGVVRDDAGHALPGASVRVIYVPTNQTITTSTDATGQFAVRNLPVGGPYNVVASDANHAAKTVQIPGITTGTYELNFTFENPSAGTAVSAVVVTGRRGATSQLQTGPRSVFTAADVETLPSFNRDPRDIARLNPFVTLDPTNNNALIIAGNNNRVNTIYVDGVKESDDFGLNASGYPTQRSPISYDLISSVDVLVAPYDVQYGSFEGGVLNITTKPGGNQFHGTAYYDYDSDKLGAGDEIRDRATIVHFTDKTYGFTLGGPIIRDKVFFEVGYEKYEGASVPGYGPADVSGIANPVPGVSSATVQQIQQILKSVYNYDTLGYGGTTPTQDRDYFAKLTWNITNQHRFVFEYQDTSGTTFNQPDSSVSSQELGLLSSTYTFQQPLKAYTGLLYSNWNSHLSTEVSYTHREVGGITVNPGGNDFANFRVYLGGSTTGPSVDIGPDISRQANILSYTDDLFRLRANYTLGQHTVSGGYEREYLNVFNLFVQNANGAYTFTSLANLQSQTAASLTYANAADNNKNDGAANWNDTLDTFYLQDEWRVLPTLTLRAGLRYDVYEQGVAPRTNPYFQQQYGFSNTSTLDGRGVLEPRIGLNWRPYPTLTVYGGFGLFSGGTPNVWISNDYTNTGNLLGQVSCNSSKGNACTASLQNVNGAQVSQQVRTLNTASANAGTGITNELDPNFKLPSVYKASIGAVKTLNFSQYGWLGRVGPILGDDWRVHADYLYQKTNEAVTWVDLLSANNVLGAAPDGRPIFNPARFTSTRTNAYDLLLTNTSKGGGDIYSAGFGKVFPWGFDFDLTYTHTNVKDVNPGTSSVALSNYSQVAISDPNHPSLALSNYNIRYQTKLTANYQRKIFGDYMSSIRMFAQRRAGLPLSYTFNSGASGSTAYDSVFGEPGAVAQRNNELLYVPATDSSGNVTATSDPKVTYGSNNGVAFDVAAFNAFLKQTGLIKYAGQISPRNEFKSRDVTNIDLQLTQEIPAFLPRGAKGEVYFSIFNLGNLINSSYGVVDQYGFPYVYPAISATLTCGAPGGTTACAPGQKAQYSYNKFNQVNSVLNISGAPPASLWAMKIGIRYKF